MSKFNPLDVSKRLWNVIEWDTAASIGLLIAVAYDERVVAPNKVPELRTTNGVTG
jgi:hypothetical protein